MRRSLAAALAALGLSLVTATAVFAILWGQPDNGRHPYVGMLAFFDADNVYSHRCSGTLVSSTVIVTAAHCTSGMASARAHFDEVVTVDRTDPRNGLRGTPFTHPGFDDFASGFAGETFDIGVVVLQKAPKGVQTGRLPTLNYLDQLAARLGTQGVTFTTVGYGVQDVTPAVVAEIRRLVAEVRLVSLKEALVDGSQIATTGAKGTGGATCFGDSGGPFFRDERTVVAVTSWGPNPTCAGTGYAYRTDTATARTFLRQFVALP
jgi:secreted trypsin-like serine protease